MINLEPSMEYEDDIEEEEEEEDNHQQLRFMSGKTKIFMTSLFFWISTPFLVGALLNIEGPADPAKTFGLGFGPAFIGGSEVSYAGHDLILDMYQVYRRYKLLAGISFDADKKYYSTYTEQDKCEGKDCGPGAVCRRGLCLCDENHQLLWGKCYTGDAWKYVTNDDIKYRKPTPPTIPQYCYMDKVETFDCEECTGKDNKRKCVTKKCKRTVKVLDPEKQKIHNECIPVVYPNEFDLKNKTCDAEDPCSRWDINAICDVSGQCDCGYDMGWNQDKMQCDLKVNVDCTEYELYYFPDGEDVRVFESLHGNNEIESPSSQSKAKTAFCLYMDGKVEEYNQYRQYLPYTWVISGYYVPGFFLFVPFGIIFAFAICAMCSYCYSECYYMNPNNALREMTGQSEGL